jgi:hypothetical protein
MGGHADHVRCSVIVNYFNLIRPKRSPSETDTELIVDPDAVPALEIPGKRFQPVSRRNSQIIKPPRGIQQVQLPGCHIPKHLWTGFSGDLGGAPVENVFRASVPKSLDHRRTIAGRPCYVKTSNPN